MRMRDKRHRSHARHRLNGRQTIIFNERIADDPARIILSGVKILPVNCVLAHLILQAHFCVIREVLDSPNRGAQPRRILRQLLRSNQNGSNEENDEYFLKAEAHGYRLAGFVTVR